MTSITADETRDGTCTLREPEKERAREGGEVAVSVMKHDLLSPWCDNSDNNKNSEKCLKTITTLTYVLAHTGPYMASLLNTMHIIQCSTCVHNFYYCPLLKRMKLTCTAWVSPVTLATMAAGRQRSCQKHESITLYDVAV
jgi:hypothetical protein